MAKADMRSGLQMKKVASDRPECNSNGNRANATELSHLKAEKPMFVAEMTKAGETAIMQSERNDSARNGREQVQTIEPNAREGTIETAAVEDLRISNRAEMEETEPATRSALGPDSEKRLDTNADKVASEPEVAAGAAKEADAAPREAERLTAETMATETRAAEEPDGCSRAPGGATDWPWSKAGTAAAATTTVATE